MTDRFFGPSPRAYQCLRYGRRSIRVWPSIIRRRAKRRLHRVRATEHAERLNVDPAGHRDRSVYSAAMPVTAKICGLSTPETLDAAIAGGASHVGFVFYPPSPRAVSFDAVRGAGGARAEHVAKVGVFVDPCNALVDRRSTAGRSMRFSSIGDAGARGGGESRHGPGSEIWAAVAVKTRADLAIAAKYRKPPTKSCMTPRRRMALCPAGWACGSTGACSTGSAIRCPGRCRAG